MNNEIMTATTYEGIEEELRLCVKDEDFRVFAQTYGPILLNICRGLEQENLSNLSKLYEQEIKDRKNEIIRSSMVKSILVLLEDNTGISVSYDNKKYFVVKQKENVKIVENTIDAPDNQILKFED
jgi:hypothetical protein